MAGASTRQGGCAIDPDMELRCSVQSGHKVWQGVARDNASVATTDCPDDSLPWRSQLLCDHPAGVTTREPRCFTTDLAGHGERGAVCVTAGDGSGMHPTTRGLEGLRTVRPVSHDLPVAHADVEKNLTACFTQPFAEMGRDAVMTVYVPKGRSETCRSMREDAVAACRRGDRRSIEECGRLVKHVFQDEREVQYACTLDTRRLPVAHEYDGREWWRWVRKNRYECRGRGVSCDDEALREYEGGGACSHDSHCAAPFEPGVCDLRKGVCATGTAKGTRCTSHEQCDHVEAVPGQCDVGTGRCRTGQTATLASYLAPKECEPTRGQRYSFCGKMQTADGERFSGVCTPYDHGGRTFYGCKAFQDSAELERIATDERDHQSQARTANFSASPPAWERLGLCPKEDTVAVGDRRVCSHTTHTVQLRGKDVAAAREDEAVQRCAASRCEEACTPGLCHRDAMSGACLPSGPHAIVARAD